MAEAGALPASAADFHSALTALVPTGVSVQVKEGKRVAQVKATKPVLRGTQAAGAEARSAADGAARRRVLFAMPTGELVDARGAEVAGASEGEAAAAVRVTRGDEAAAAMGPARLRALEEAAKRAGVATLEQEEAEREARWNAL